MRRVLRSIGILLAASLAVPLGLIAPAVAGDCPGLTSGRWVGTWQSDDFAGLNGTVVARLFFDGGKIRGTLTTAGSPLSIGGPVRGTSDCASVTFHTVVGFDAEFTGTVDAAGNHAEGTYTLADGADTGTWDGDLGAEFENRPDATIRAISPEPGVKVGNDIYNTDGQDQTLTVEAAPGTITTFAVRFQNDGDVKDTFRVLGPGSTTDFRVRYYLAGANATAAVTAGILRLTDIRAGTSSRALTIEVKTRNVAPPGASIDVLVEGRSVNVPSARDAVAASVSAPVS